MAQPKMKIQKLIINLDDNSSDDEDILNITLNQKEIRDMNALIEDEDDNDDEKNEEMKKITDIINQAIIPITKFNSNFCKLLTSQYNCVTNITEFDQKYDELTSKIEITSKNAILIPYYINCVAFSTIRWLKLNANNNLTKQLKSMQLNFLLNTNPAMWVCEENEEEHDLRKVCWIAQINTRINKVPSNVFHTTSNSINHFILMEYNYLTQGSLKGLCGLCMFVCKLTNDGYFELVDIANIKISCNTANRVYGNIIKMLDKYPNTPIFLYIPQNLTHSVLLNTYLHPWSQFITSQYDRIYNIITIIQLDSEPIKDLEKMCIDSDIHFKSCAICNCLNLYMKLASNLFNPRSLCEVLNKTLVSPLHETSTILPRYVSCKQTKFITYGRNASSIIDSNCSYCSY